jgi:hypothetical protein
VDSDGIKCALSNDTFKSQGSQVFPELLSIKWFFAKRVFFGYNLDNSNIVGVHHETPFFKVWWAGHAWFVHHGNKLSKNLNTANYCQNLALESHNIVYICVSILMQRNNA